MIIQIRGCNGSGKTHAVQGVMNEYGQGRRTLLPIVGWGADELHKFAERYDEVLGTAFEIGNTTIIALGEYRDDKPSGGCDNIKTQDQVCNRLRLFRVTADVVLFEGVIHSTIYQRYADLYDELYERGASHVQAYLDTSYEQCKVNIEARRETSRVKRKAVNEDVLTAKYRSIARTRPKFEQAGYDVRTLHYEASVETLLDWIVNPVKYQGR